MNVKLDSLIEKIRSEAVDGGKVEAADIIKNAKAEAAAIIEQAETKAGKIRKDAEIDAEKTREKTQQALKQAARDVELSLKERISSLFDRVFRQQVLNTFSPDFLEKLILDLVKEWAVKGSVDIVVNPDIQAGLEKMLYSHLNEELKKGVTLVPGQTRSTGFRIALKGGSVYYDFSVETVAEILKEFINPTLRALLEEDSGKN